MTKTVKSILLAGGVSLAICSSAWAETYRFSSWNSPNEPTTIANQWFVDEVSKVTNGEISFEHFTGGAIMPPNSHLQGLGDGVAQAGQVTVGYTPSDLPINASIAGFGFIEPDPIAIGAAYADWFMHDAAAKAEWAGHDVVPVAGFSTPEYSLMCNTSEAVTTRDQMNGLKVRAYGLIGALVKDLGGVPVGMPASEAYQALQTGALDCASLSANWLRDGKLEEVTSWTTLTAWTPAFNSPQMTFNKEFWQGLTNEQRATIFELAARTEAKAHVLYAQSATAHWRRPRRVARRQRRCRTNRFKVLSQSGSRRASATWPASPRTPTVSRIPRRYSPASSPMSSSGASWCAA